MNFKIGKQNGRRRALATGASALAAAAAALSATPAVAQDVEEEEAVIVTGTRIPQPNLYTTSPVTQVTSEDITTQGVTRVEDLTNQLPQVFAAQGSNVANGATGTAQVNLRGLGASRTLVLINGRRMGYGSPISAPSDLNQIPGPLVERVEVLTGGASAVYGSDAVSGVVNFIMRDDFEGVRLDAQYGLFMHHNDYDGPGNLREVIAGRGQTNPAEYQLPPDDITEGIGKEITFVVGVTSPDNRGNITAYAGYRSNDAVLQSQYDYSACTIGVDERDNLGPDFACGGSGTSAGGSFQGGGLPATLTLDQSVGDSTIGSGAFRLRNSATDLYNFAPFNHYQRPDERYTFGAFARYEINPNVEVYGQLMHSEYSSLAQIAPSGNFGNTGTINCADTVLLSASQYDAICNSDRVRDIVDDPDTPFDEVNDFINGIRRAADGSAILPDQPLTPEEILENTALVAGSIGTQSCNSDDPNNPNDSPRVADPNDCPLLILRRNVEGGPRIDELRYESYRMVAGFRGPLGDAWDYDVSGSFTRVLFADTYHNDFSVTRLTRALDVIAHPDTGEPVCRSVVDGSDPNCVPYNIFSPGGVTQAALDYLQIPLMATGEAVQQNVIASITGEFPWTSPLAESPVAAAFGVEYRRDEISQMADAAYQTADGAGQGGPFLPLAGDVDVTDVFGELRLPLAEGQSLADLLALDLAYRYSSYSTGVETDTYKVGLEWAPSSDIRFRASQQRAVRAANIIELFAAQGFGLFAMAYDPCDATQRPTSAGPVPVSCIGSNPWQVSTAQSNGGDLYSSAGQYNGLFGGNPDLEPEEADTMTLGFVFTPSFLPGFNLSVDYFNIEVSGLIATTGAQNTLSDCYDFNNAASCARIVRDPGTGALWIGQGRVEDLNTNIGGLESTGIDINANYRVDIGSYGGLTFQLIGTWLDELITDPGLAAVDPYDCAGSFGEVCGSPNPEWRHRFRVGWQTPWKLDLNLTWRYYDEVQQVDAVNQPVSPALDSVFDAENYFDISGNYQMFDNANIRFGVNNLLDDNPPLSGRAGANGNTFPQIYDSLGRWVFAGITIDW